MGAPGTALRSEVEESDSDSLRRAFAERAELLIYKHPPTCWAGVRAAREIAALLQGDPELTVWHVVVTSERALSNQLAELFGVRHESPQAFLLRHGNVVWTGSHHEVSEARIAEARRPATDVE